MRLDLMVFILEIICLKQYKNGAYVIDLDEYADVIGLLCIQKLMKLFTLAALVLNMFVKKSKKLMDIKSQKKKYLEYKQTIQ